MSEYGDVSYNADSNVQENCLKELSNCDVVIHIIGSNLGSFAVPEMRKAIDLHAISAISSYPLEPDIKLSITQCEILHAKKENIPIYSFIDKKVLTDYDIIEKNQSLKNDIKLLTIDNNEKAEYIFSFYKFLKNCSLGNSIMHFENISDIKDSISKQLSGYFQYLLQNTKKTQLNKDQFEKLHDNINDLKTMFISTISDGMIKDVGKAILNYRSLIEFLSTITSEHELLICCNLTWDKLLDKIGVKEIVQNENFLLSGDMPLSYIIMKDDNFFYKTSHSVNTIKLSFKSSWDLFSRLSNDVRRGVVSSIVDYLGTIKDSKSTEKCNENFSKFIINLTAKYNESVIYNFPTKEKIISEYKKILKDEKNENIYASTLNDINIKL